MAIGIAVVFLVDLHPMASLGADVM